MNSLGNRIKIEVFGSSHSEELGCIISGLPEGKRIDMALLRKALARRSAAMGGAGATARREPDEPEITGGFFKGAGESVMVTDGAPMKATFRNKNVRREDYGRIARPSHADFAAFKKYGEGYELSGGGQSSGRMTLPLVFAGAVCAELLRERGISVFSHVLRIGSVWDDRFDPMAPELGEGADLFFPLVNTAVKARMEAEIKEAKQRGDTLSCECECAALGLPAGIGEPFFNGLESELSRLLFSIPGLRGLEFGEREHVYGSEMNDGFGFHGATMTNRSGGVNGGISNGMPLVFRAWFRPVPSISLPQQGYDLKAEAPAPLSISGRHDTCILPRGCAAVEAAASIGIYDLLRCNDER